MWRDRIEWACKTIRERSARPTLGCSEKQVHELRGLAGGTLPAAYELFLLLVGADPGDFMRGYDLRASALRHLDEQFRLVVSEMSGPPIPVDAVVYFGSQDFQFWFFRASAGPDPRVFTYVDSEPHVFSDLRRTLSEDIELMVREQYCADVERAPEK